MAKDIRIKIASDFDGKGVRAAEMSVARLGDTIKGAFKGIGGKLSELSGIVATFMRGGIWESGAQLFVTAWKRAIDAVHAKANAAREAAKKKHKEYLESIEKNLANIRAAMSDGLSAIDKSVAKRKEELEATKELAKAEVELARQRKLAAGGDARVVNAEAAAKVAALEQQTAGEKSAAALAAAKERVKTAMDAAAAAQKELDTLKKTRDEMTRIAATERAEYLRTHDPRRTTRFGRRTHRRTNAEMAEVRRNIAERYDSGEDVQQRRKEIKELEQKIAEAEKLVKNANGEVSVANHKLNIAKLEAQKAQLANEAGEKESANRRIELERKIAIEKRKQRQEEIADRLKMYRDALAQERTLAKAAQAEAQSKLQQAWGWYRDKGSMAAQLEEEKAEAQAEAQYETDFARLQRKYGRNWRDAEGLSIGDEAVRRVAIAREEADEADRYAEATARASERSANALEHLEKMFSETSE